MNSNDVKSGNCPCDEDTDGSNEDSDTDDAELVKIWLMFSSRL